MYKLLNKRLICFDCDDTLIMWDSVKNLSKAKIGKVVKIKSPDTHKRHKLIINDTMVNLIKEHKAHGDNILVWSAGGSQWAFNVCEALHLLDFIDVICDKPSRIYDDWPASSWMPKSEWLPPESPNGGGWVLVNDILGGTYRFLSIEHKYWEQDDEGQRHFRLTGQIKPKK